jgi:hypothetical protein
MERVKGLTLAWFVAIHDAPRASFMFEVEEAIEEVAGVYRTENPDWRRRLSSGLCSGLERPLSQPRRDKNVALETEFLVCARKVGKWKHAGERCCRPRQLLHIDPWVSIFDGMPDHCFVGIHRQSTGTRNSGLEFFDGLSPLFYFSSAAALTLPGPQSRMADSSNNGSHLDGGGSSWRNSGRRGMPAS